MARTYKIEKSIEALVAQRVRETGESEEKAAEQLSEDPVAISSVAVDANVPAKELAGEIREFRALPASTTSPSLPRAFFFSRARRERPEPPANTSRAPPGLEVNQNFLKLDQNMQKMLQRKSSDKKRMQNILAAVHEGLEREESFVNKVREVSNFAKKKNKKEQAHSLKVTNLSMYEVRRPRLDL